MNVQLHANLEQRQNRPVTTKQRKSDAVFQDLKRRILTGDMGSDTPITEQALAHRYECSQGTVREALLQLQECGLVVRRGYRGTYVTDPGLVEAMLLLKLRTEIEIAGLAKSALNVTPGQLDDLRDMDHQLEECRTQQDVFSCAELDRNLHLKLFKIAEMPVLEPMLIRASVMLQRLMLPSPRPKSLWQSPAIVPHSVIFDAVETGDAQVATNAIKAHILSNAVLLAPHFYGTDAERLQKSFEDGTNRFASLMAVGA